MVTSKTVIIGAGSVGTAIAYAIIIKGLSREVCLIDREVDKVKGEVLDLSHGLPYVSQVEVSVGEYSDCADASIIIITAGAKQKPNETRIDLVNRNIEILKSIMESIKANLGKNQPVIIVVANPCDILTYFAQQFSGLPRNKVIGSGTVLDSARLRYGISNLCKIDAKNIHGYVVGEHGDSEVILWSSLRVGLSTFTEMCSHCTKKCTPEVKQHIEDQVRNAAYEIIKTKGYTNFGVGLAVARIVEVILKDSNTILPVSVVLEGEYGEKNVALSVPCVVNRNGMREIMSLEFSRQEKELFHASAEKLRSVIESIKK